MHEDEVLFTEFFNQKLKERGYTLKQLADQTGIAIKHLESFSSGRFEHLPSAPYVHGYFVRLSEILGFDPDEWWSRIREEDTVHKAGSGDRMPGNRFGRMRGKALLWSLVILALVGIYVAARYTTILGEPQLTVTAPPADQVSASSGSITFQGIVKNGDTLTVNAQNVPLGADGSWSTEVALQPGPNTVAIQARKILGRTVTLTRQIYYAPSTPVILPVTIPSSSSASSGIAQ